MIVQRIHGIRTLVAVAQGIVVTVAFWFTYGAMIALKEGSLFFAERYAIYWIAVLAGFALEGALRSPEKTTVALYESSAVRHIPVALRQLVFALGGLLLLVVVAKDLAISRAFLLLFAVVLYPALLWTNVALPVRIAQWLFRGTRVSGTLLIGPARRVTGLEDWLAHKEKLGVRVAGLLATDGAMASPSPKVPLLGGLDRLDAILDEGAISQVILLELASPELARKLVEQCELHGIRLLIVNDFAERIHRPIVSRVDEGVNLLMLFEEPLENPFNRVLKRALDLVVAVPIVLFVLPVLAVIVWGLHRLQSPGPLLHRQARAGLQNKAFEIFKFRTMHPAHGDEAVQARQGDTRVFPAGRWLRRFSLDEMPQFLNVWRGQMSVVGPRPHLIEHNREFAEVLANYHVRSFIKPGISGLAQVRGFRGEARTHEDIAARLQSDLIYIENWSLSLDLSIIARTVGQMIRPPRTAQ